MMGVSWLLREAPKTVEEAGYVPQGENLLTALPKQFTHLRIHVHSRSGTHFPTVPLNPSMRVCVKKASVLLPGILELLIKHLHVLHVRVHCQLLTLVSVRMVQPQALASYRYMHTCIYQQHGLYAH